MPAWLLIALFALIPAAQTQAARQLLADVRCIETVRAGDALLGGIHGGSLPRRIFIKRCDGLWLRLALKDGRRRITAIPTRHMPRFLARRKPFAIPDARVTVGARNIREAWLTRPTRRHAHGMLGDAIEAGGLAVASRAGRRVEYRLPAHRVFEDRMARLVDLDGDAATDEIVTVLSDRDKGAALAVFALTGRAGNERLQPLARSAFIGRASRWLHPIVAADFDGDGRPEIAWVETPHIGGVLKVARLSGAGNSWRLRMIGRLAGFSTHVIGSRTLQQAVTFDFDADGRADIILPDASRKALKVVAFKGGALRVIATLPFSGEIDSPLVAADLDGDGRGEAYFVTRDARLLVFSPLPSRPVIQAR